MGARLRREDRVENQNESWQLRIKRDGPWIGVDLRLPPRPVDLDSTPVGIDEDRDLCAVAEISMHLLPEIGGAAGLRPDLERDVRTQVQDLILRVRAERLPAFTPQPRRIGLDERAVKQHKPSGRTEREPASILFRPSVKLSAEPDLPVPGPPAGRRHDELSLGVALKLVAW